MKKLLFFLGLGLMMLIPASYADTVNSGVYCRLGTEGVSQFKFDNSQFYFTYIYGNVSEKSKGPFSYNITPVKNEPGGAYTFSGNAVPLNGQSDALQGVYIKSQKRVYITAPDMLQGVYQMGGDCKWESK